MKSFTVILPVQSPLPLHGGGQDGGGDPAPDHDPDWIRDPLSGLGPDSTGDPDLDRLVAARRFDEGCC